jgi:hypothetical protein
MSHAMSHTPEKEPHNSKKRLSDLNLDKKEPTSKKLLKFAGTWKGDDFKVCLEAVYKTRGETTF